MPDDPDRARGNWAGATEPDLETLRLVIQLVREYHELTGAWPSAMELRASLRRPGS